MDINDLFANGLDLNDAMDLLSDVALYVVGMAVYAVFVFNFYRFLAAKDMFRVDLSRYEQSRFPLVRRVLHVFFYVLKYIILFPIFAFFWFAVLTLILALLSKERSFADTLLVALATVSAVRMTAYYKEELSGTWPRSCRSQCWPASSSTPRSSPWGVPGRPARGRGVHGEHRLLPAVPGAAGVRSAAPQRDRGGAVPASQASATVG